MEAIAATGDEFNPVFRPYLQSPDVLKKMAADANVVARRPMQF